MLKGPRPSFYSSQGRQTSFPDHNVDLIARLMTEHKDLATLEVRSDRCPGLSDCSFSHEPSVQMETFHILHLASCWDIEAQDDAAEAPPVSHPPTAPSISPTHPPSAQTKVPDVAASTVGSERLRPPPRIRAASAQMVFASRTSQDFITPQQVATIEAWTGREVLEALAGLVIEPDVSPFVSH